MSHRISLNLRWEVHHDGQSSSVDLPYWYAPPIGISSSVTFLRRFGRPLALSQFARVSLEFGRMELPVVVAFNGQAVELQWIDQIGDSRDTGSDDLTVAVLKPLTLLPRNTIELTWDKSAPMAGVANVSLTIEEVVHESRD